MCKKLPEQCKAKVKCECCKVLIDNSENHDKISLNEIGSCFQEQQYIILVKENNYEKR